MGLRQAPREWVRRLIKLGYAVKGVVYATMAVFALQVALGGGGRLIGEHEAVEHIGRQPFGAFLLVLIAAGFFAYALSRAIEGILDTHHEGKGWKGAAVRLGSLGSALINGAVGVAALQLVIGNEAHHENPKAHAASLLAEPGGLAVVALLGVSVIGAAGYQFYAAYKDTFLRHLSLGSLAPGKANWIRWSGKVGHAARGVVFAIIGVALVRTALTTNPRQAKGLKEALVEIVSQPFGQVLLTVVATGFLAYAAYLIATIPYRRSEV